MSVASVTNMRYVLFLFPENLFLVMYILKLARKQVCPKNILKLTPIKWTPKKSDKTTPIIWTHYYLLHFWEAAPWQFLLSTMYLSSRGFSSYIEQFQSLLQTAWRCLSPPSPSLPRLFCEAAAWQFRFKVTIKRDSSINANGLIITLFSSSSSSLGQSRPTAGKA